MTQPRQLIKLASPQGCRGESDLEVIEKPKLIWVEITWGVRAGRALYVRNLLYAGGEVTAEFARRETSNMICVIRRNLDAIVRSRDGIYHLGVHCKVLEYGKRGNTKEFEHYDGLIARAEAERKAKEQMEVGR